MDATFMLFVAKRRRNLVRNGLPAELLEPIRWRERKTFSGSEFYFSGPSALARQVHAFATKLVRDADVVL